MMGSLKFETSNNCFMGSQSHSLLEKEGNGKGIV